MRHSALPRPQVNRVVVGGVAICMLAAAGAGLAITWVHGAESGAYFPIALILMVGIGTGVSVTSIQACRKSLRNGNGLTRVASGLTGAGLVIVVALSGFQLVAGLRESKLVLVGFPQGDSRGAVTGAFFFFVLAELCLVGGERLVSWRAARETRFKAPTRVETKSVYFALVGMALVSVALTGIDSQQEIFENRGAVQGDGLVQLLGTSSIMAATLGVTQRHWGDRRLAALSLLLVASNVALGGNRTPLAIVGTAVLIRLLVSTADRRYTIRAVIAAVLVVYVSLVTLVAVSDWRDSVRRGQSASLTSFVVRAAADPFPGLSRGGLDTLDGFILARQVDREAVDARATDPVVALTTFVPRSIWPDKPTFVSNRIATYYTNFGGPSGLFLSGAGYTYVVFGGALGMMLTFLVLGFTVELALRHTGVQSIWSVLVVYFVVRFFFAGDASDLFHVLGLALLVWAAYGVSWSATLLSRDT